MKKVGIIGCGWLGYRIAEYLSVQYDVYATTTTPDKIEPLTIKGFKPTIVHFSEDIVLHELKQWEVLTSLDSIIITVPFSEKDLLRNRLQNLCSFLGDFNGQLFYMSSTSVYPDIEQTFSEEDISSEALFGEGKIKEKYPQVNILRLAGLMGDNRLLRNYKVTNLNFAVNHIHYKDICRVIEIMIERSFNSKLYNVVAPLHPSKSDVINAQKNISYSAHCAINGKKISSSKLIAELDFDFKFPDPRKFH